MWMSLILLILEVTDVYDLHDVDDGRDVADDLHGSSDELRDLLRTVRPLQLRQARRLARNSGRRKKHVTSFF